MTETISNEPAVSISDDLVERLLEPCRDYTGELIVRNSTPRYEIHCALLYDAAARIQSLTAERDALKGETFKASAETAEEHRDNAIAMWQASQAQVATLQEALDHYAKGSWDSGVRARAVRVAGEDPAAFIADAIARFKDQAEALGYLVDPIDAPVADTAAQAAVEMRAAE